MKLLACLIIASVWAADPISTAIEQAQGLALKKDRQAALKVLNKAIEAAAPPLKGRAKLIETELSIGKVFVTDKGQRLYESGQSAMFDNPDSALTQYKEALTLEDNNILLLDSVAQVQLAKQDCTGAASTLHDTRLYYPYAAEPALLELRTMICLKNFEGLREKIRQLPALEKGTEYMVQYFTAQDFLNQKMSRKASDILTRVSEEEPKFPETYYYLVKAGLELGKDVETTAQKYISLCKGVTMRERKKYSLEPTICGNTKEVEDVLAKKTDL